MIKKRNGELVEYDHSKILGAVEKAFKSQNYPGIPDEIIDKFSEENFKELDHVEDIQDKIEFILYCTCFRNVYNSFVKYRGERALLREAKTKKTFESIVNLEKNDVTNDNANMNAESPAGQMMKYAGELTKPYSINHLLSKEVRKAFKDNYIYIHDLDYAPTRSLTCLQTPLDKILSKGFAAGHGESRAAKRIETASMLAAISLETTQNEMHGGQAIPAFDFYMAPYVRKAYIEEIKRVEEVLGTSYKDLYDTPITDYIQNLNYEGLTEKEKIKQIAINNTVKRVYQSMESFVHNMNSIHSRGGNQVVFSSINYGTDTSAEGRCVIRELLKTTYEGIGSGQTAIFPIQVWKLKEGVNKNPGDPNYDLYKESWKVSARRFFPNYLNLDSTYNKDDAWDENDPRRFEHEVATMGALAGHEHLYIKIGDNEPIDISIKNLFDACKSNIDIIGRPSQIWYNKQSVNEPTPGKHIQQQYNFPNKPGVYSITYLPEDVTYIGSSNSISRRLAEHRHNIKKTGGLDAGPHFGDTDLRNYEIKILELTENYKEHEKYYIEKCPNINLRGTDNKFYKNITQKNRIYKRPNFKQNLSIQQDLINLNHLDIKVLDRDNKWVKIKHIFKNDKQNSPLMMHIYYKECGKEMCLSCTEDHPLWNGKNFIRADQYKIGDNIYRGDGLAVEVTDICWHWRTVDSYDIGTETGSFIGSDIIMHNCRTRTYANAYGPKTSIGRGNLSFTTINLPKMAIEVAIKDGYLEKYKGEWVHTKKVSTEDIHRRVKEMKKKLKKYVYLAGQQLDERFNFQKQALKKQFPLLMNGLWIGSENLKPNDSIEPVINQGTLAIGFIGLAEALIALVGKHHGESPLAQSIGLELIEYMNELNKDMCEKYQHNYAIFATPAEGLSGRFTIVDAKKYGEIKGITDKKYYTNSNHVPVYYKCTPKHKAEIEGPYHKLTPGGHIFYVEADADITKNPEVIGVINTIACDNDCGYISINHSQGRCVNCNWESNEPGLKVCPVCGGQMDILQRITGYLTSTTDKWCFGKKDELKDRVTHA